MDEIGREMRQAARRLVRSPAFTLATVLTLGVSPRDPGVFAATTVTLLGVALLACWLPARRAARLSPLEALRTD